MNEWEPPSLTASSLPQAAFPQGPQDGRPTCSQTRSAPCSRASLLTNCSRTPPHLQPAPSLDPVAMPLLGTPRSSLPVLPAPQGQLPQHRRPHLHGVSAPGSPRPGPPTVSTSPWARRRGPTRSRAGVSSAVSPPTPSFLWVPSGPAPPGSPCTHARDCLTPCENFQTCRKVERRLSDAAVLLLKV